MKDTTIYGTALIVGSLGMILTMILHPTGPEVRSAGVGAAHTIEVAVYVHALAIGTIPIGFFGFLGLSRFLGTSRLAVQFALILYAFSNIAGMCAAAFSGFGATQVAKEAMRTDDTAANQFLQVIYQYNGIMNQGFAKVMFVCLTISIVMWSLCILQVNAMAKVIGTLGIVIAASALLAFVIGLLRLDVYGFGLFVLAHSIWTITLAGWMIRASR